ncbi:MAG: hypothetical protein HY719_05430 [Planctomycetes bacterium]|nr:hypothetical protein [Planctomycetota bacterium]
MNLDATRIVDRWEDKGARVVYALAVLDRHAFAETVADRIRRAHATAERAAAAADTHAARGNRLEALASLYQARDQLVEAEGHAASLRIGAPPGFEAPRTALTVGAIEKQILDATQGVTFVIASFATEGGAAADPAELEAEVVSLLRARGLTVRIAPAALKGRGAGAIKALSAAEMARDAAPSGDYLILVEVGAEVTSAPATGGNGVFFYASSYSYNLWNTRTGEVLAAGARRLDRDKTKSGNPSAKVAAAGSIRLAAGQAGQLVADGLANRLGGG